MNARGFLISISNARLHFPLVFYPCNTGIMTVPFVKSPKLWSLWIFISEITINCLNYNIKHLFSKFVLQFSFLMIAIGAYKNYINAFLYVHVDYSKYIIEH